MINYDTSWHGTMEFRGFSADACAFSTNSKPFILKGNESKKIIFNCLYANNGGESAFKGKEKSLTLKVQTMTPEPPKYKNEVNSYLFKSIQEKALQAQIDLNPPQYTTV